MYRSVLTLRCKPGRREDLLEVFARLGILRRSLEQRGAVDTTLVTALDDDDLVLVIASWRSPQAYQGWLDNPERAGITAELEPLLAVPGAAQTFSTVDFAVAEDK